MLIYTFCVCYGGLKTKWKTSGCDHPGVIHWVGPAGIDNGLLGHLDMLNANLILIITYQACGMSVFIATHSIIQLLKSAFTHSKAARMFYTQSLLSHTVLLRLRFSLLSLSVLKKMMWFFIIMLWEFEFWCKVFQTSARSWRKRNKRNRSCVKGYIISREKSSEAE